MVQAVGSSNFTGEEKKKSSGIIPGVVAAGIAYPASLYGWKSPMKSDQIAGLSKDEFQKQTKDLKDLDDTTKGVVEKALEDKTKIGENVGKELEKIFGKEGTDIDAKEILTADPETYKKSIDTLEQSVLKDVKSDDGKEITKKGLETRANEAEETAKAKEAAAGKEGATDAVKTEAKAAREEANKLSQELNDTVESIKNSRAQLALVNKDGKITREAYSGFLKTQEEGKVVSEIEKVADKLKGLKAKSKGKAALVAAGAGIVTYILAKAFSPKSNQA